MIEQPKGDGERGSVTRNDTIMDKYGRSEEHTS